MQLVTNYMKNITKSVAYAAADVGKNELMPNIASFSESNTDFLKSTYAALKNPKIAVQKGVDAFKDSKIFQAIDYGAKNTFEDLRTGKFYNKEREDRDQLKLAGLDVDSWNDLSEFGVDDDWESNINSTNKSDEVTKGDLQIVGAIESSNAAAANATVNAIIATSNHSIQNTRVNTSIMYQQNERLFGGLHNDFSVLNATMDAILKITSVTLQNIDKNTSGFFTESLKLDTERNAMIKEILEMERNKYKTALDREKEAQNKSNKKFRWSDINADGAPDFDSYINAIKTNISNQIQNSVGFSGLGEDSNMLATFMVSPLKFIPQAIVKGVIPSTIKLAVQELDKTVSGIFGQIIGRLGNARANGDSGIFGILSKIFGINTGVNRNIDNSKYEKGAVPFDGITRKAIIDVIPTHLRRIEAALTGSEEMMYDYNDGRWVKPRDVRNQYKQIRKDAIRTGTQEIREEFDKHKDKVQNSNIHDKDDFDKALEEFYEYLYENNGIFNPKVSAEKNGIDYRYSHLKKYYKVIAEMYKNFDIAVDKKGNKYNARNSVRVRSARNVLDAKDREEKIYRSIESDPTNIIYQLMGSPESNPHLHEIKEGGKSTGKFKLAHNMLLDTKDKYNNTIFDYLQTLAKELKWQRINSANIGYPVSGKGGNIPNNKIVSFEDIKIDAKNTTNPAYTRTNYNYDSSLRSAVNKIESGKAMDLAWINQDEAEALLYLKHLIETDSIDENNKAINEAINSSSVSKFMDKNFWKREIKDQKDLDEAKKYDEDKKDTKEEDKAPSIFKKMQDKISKFTEAPAEIFTDLLYTADRAIYYMFFRMDLKDDETNEPCEGFMDFLTKKTSNAFEKIKDSFNEKILNPIKEKLGIDDKFSKKFKDTIHDDLSTIGQFFISSNKDVYDEIKGFVKSPKEISENIKGKARKKYSSNIEKMLSTDNLLDDEYRQLLRDNGLNPLDFASKKDADEALSPLLFKALLDKSNYTKEFYDQKQLGYMFKAIDMLPNDEKIKFLEKAAEVNELGKLKGKDINEIFNDFKTKKLEQSDPNSDDGPEIDYGPFGGSNLATGTMGRPFSGNTMLSKGELLFNEDGVSRVKKTDAYHLNKPTHILNSVDSSLLLGEKPKSTIAKDLANENSIKNRILANHAGGTTTLNINGRDVDMKPYIEEAKKYVPETLAGGAIGGIASTLLGLAGGPLLGAGIGAAVQFVASSDLLKNALFGKLDKDGNRKGGFIKKTVIDSVKKYAPDMLKYGAAGIIPGLITPLGPIGGLLVGGTIGLLKNNESISNRLYGDKNNILGVNEKTKKVLKDMIPGAAKGAAVGAVAKVLFGGPFGLLGNAALGAGIGILTSTDEFKDSMLGKSINGVRMGGALGAFKQALEPLAKAGIEIKDKLLEILDKNIVNPLQRFVTPTIHAIPQFAGFLVRKMNEKLEDKFLNPLSSMLKDKFIQPIATITGKILKPIVTWPAKIATSPFKLLGKVGDSIKKKQLRTHNADYMTAEERVKAREDLGMESDVLDLALAGIGKEGGLSVGDARNLRNNILSIVDNSKDVTKAKKNSERDINNIIDNFTTEDGKGLSPKAKDKVRKALYKGDIKAAQKALTEYKLTGSNRTLTEKEAENLLNGKDDKTDMSLTDYMKKYTDLHNREKQANYMTKETKDSAKASVIELMGQLGYDTSKGISNRELVKLASMLDTEITRNEANPDNIGKELDLATEQTGYLKSLVEQTGELKDYIKTIVTGNTEFIKDYNDVKTSDVAQAQNHIFNVYESRKNDFAEVVGDDAANELSEEDIDVVTSGTAGRFRKKAKKQNNVTKYIENGNISASEIGSTNGGSNLNRIHTIKGYGYSLEKDAIKFITKCSKTAYSSIKTVLKDKYVRKISEGRSITLEDVKLIAEMRSGKPSFCKRCKILVEAGKTSSDYESFDAIVKESPVTIQIIKNNTQTSNIINKTEQVEDNSNTDDIPKNGIGTFLLGAGKSLLGGISNLFGGGESEEKSDNNKVQGAAAALASATQSIANAGNNDTSGSLDETDKQGDGKDKIIAGDGTVLQVKKGSDGSVDHDMSDPTTKKYFNIKNKKDAIMEKLQNLQMSASEKINTIFDGIDDVKKKAKKGMGLLGALIFGGILWKSGILTKIWDNALVPLWKERIKPFINNTVFPWLRDTVFPALGNIIKDSIPLVAGAIANGALTIGDTITGNTTNVGGTTTIDPSGKTGQTAMYDQNGNKLTYEDIQNQNFEEIYNADGTKGYINEDGTISFDDPSFRGSSYLKVVGNGAAHAFTQGKAGLLTKGLNKASNFALRHGGIIGKAVGASGKMITAPVKAAGNLGSKVSSKIASKAVDKAVDKGLIAAASETAEQATKPNGIIGKIGSGITKAKNYIGNTKALANLVAENGDEAFELADNVGQKVGAKLINSKVGKTVGKGASKVSGLLNKVIEGAKNIITKLLENSTVLSKIRAASEVIGESSLGNFVKGLKTKLDDIFVDAITKGAKEAGEATITKAASKLNLIATIAFAIKDFIWGCDQAESILGVTETNLLEELACGLCNAICNLVVIPAIIPGVPWCAQKLIGFFEKDFEEKQAAAEKEYLAWKEETGSTATKEEYLKEQYSVTGKIGKGIKNIGNKIKGGFKSAGKKLGEWKDSAGEKLGNLKDAAVDKIKGAAKTVSDTVSGAVDKVKKTGSNIADLGKNLWKYVKSGDITGLMGYNTKLEGTEDYTGDLSKSQVGIAKLGVFIPTVISALGHKIADGVSSVIDGVKTIGTSAGNTIWTMKDYLLSGDISGLIGYQPQKSDNALADGTSSVVSNIGKFTMFMPTVASAGIHKVVDGVKFVIDKLKTVGSTAVDTVWTMKDYLLSGDINGLINFNPPQSDNALANATSAVVTNVGRIAMFMPTVASAGIHKVVDGVKTVIDTGKAIGASIGNVGGELIGFVKSGDTEGLSNYTIGEGEGPLHKAGEAVTGIAKVMLTPATYICKGVNSVKQGFDKLSNSIAGIKTETDSVIDKAKNGDISLFSKKYWNVSTQESGFVGGISKVYGFMNRLLNAPAVLVGNIFGKIKDTIEGIKDWILDKIDGIEEFFENPLGYIYGKITGKEIDEDDDDGEGTTHKRAGTGSFRFGRGYAKQTDPSVAYMRYNTSNDTERQTIGDSACGPVAAVNAVKYAYGRGNNRDDILSATNYALKGGYKERNGGTTPSFFRDYFNKNGLDSSLSRNKSALAENIISGRPTVLMGKDPNGVSNSTPFGAGSHYVTATGVDNKGRVIIQDPESRYDNQLYNLNDVLSKTTLGVSAYGRGTYNRRVRSITPRNSRTTTKYGRGDVAAQVWYFLRNSGFTEEATAGLMGNFKQESGMNPACIQGNGRGPAAGLFQMENYNTKSDRWAEMAAYARSKGKDWTDLQCQLEYLIMTMDSQFKTYTGKEYTYSNGTKAWWPEKLTADDFKKITSISKATEIFERVYERASKPMMDKRIKYANEYYSQFTGKSGEAIGNSLSSTSSAVQQKKFQLSDIGTIFTQFLSDTKAGKALSLLNNIMNTSDSTANAAVNGGSASGDAAAFINAAAADVGYKETGNNITKFGKWYGMDGQPWCAMFVSHAANKAGISTDVIPKYSYCPTGYEWFKSRGQTVSGSEAKAGDIVFFKNSDRMYHTGIVEDVSNGEIHTIEGNSSDMVARRTYSTSDSKLYFGRPKFANTSGDTTTNSGNYAALTDAPDVANTRGGNCCKPVSKYGLFKETLSGRGKLSTPASRTGNANMAEMNSSLINTGKSINVKTKSGSFNRVEDTSGTGSYGRGKDSIDYTKLLNVILTTLVTIADNTDKLNAVVEILNEKLGLDIQPKGNTESLKSKLKKVLINNKDTSLNTYMDTLNSQSMYSIINAMNAIASE